MRTMSHQIEYINKEIIWYKNFWSQKWKLTDIEISVKLPNSISEMVEERISELEDKLGLSNLRKKKKESEK